MDEFERLYTVEDIARMTSFTSRTIRNYLKDGSLQGRKIGGQWRFTMENIKQLFNNSIFTNDVSRKNRQRILNFIGGANTEIQGKIQVCTIVDYYCENPKAGHQIYEKLVTVINNKGNDFPAKFDYEFIEKENKARFTLFGNPDYIIKTLQLL
ncbi:MAG: MerR family transcriptional regulator [Chloroflexi bacterium RBG_13_51_18]|nr:MAG: MerR family transcriptional regulator [Chloroflexi bacterium RBG_13_51_18]